MRSSCGGCWVHAENAVSGSGSWSLCDPIGKPVCTGNLNKPGDNQVTVMTFAQEVANYQILTGEATCDTEF